MSQTTGLARVFRITVALHAILIAGQVLSSGFLFNGSRAALIVHEHGAQIAQIVCLLVLVLAVLLRRSGQASRAIVIVAIALFFGEALQTALGYRHVLPVHVPLGIAIVIGNVRLLDLVFERRSTGTVGIGSVSG
jgi:uncharacterized membrane protein YgdD (TMEM256/DUF423 family)